MFEGKEKEYLLSLLNINRRIKVATLSYLNFLSIKTEGYKDNYFNYKYDNISEKKIIEVTKEEIIKRNENFVKIIEKELPLLFEIYTQINEYIEKFKNYSLNNRNNQDLFIYYENHKIKSMKIIQSKEIIQKSDFINLIFKSMIILAKDLIIRESVKADRKLNYFWVRNKVLNKLTRQNVDLERPSNILDFIKGYIKSNFQNNNIEIFITITNLPNKNYSRFRILSPYPNRPNQIPSYYNNQLVQINIKIYPLNILISLPMNKELNYNVYKFALSVKDEYKIHSNPELILFKKIKILLNERIISILNLIYEDKKRKISLIMNNKPILFDEESLREFLKKFINYIYDYNLINKIKCGLCQNIIKYSFIEKCFLPPFYKLYRERENQQQNVKNNENETNLFFHEDCFRKMGNKFL